MERTNETWRLLLYTRTVEAVQPSRTHKAEQKKIEVELWQRKDKLLCQRMEGIENTETQEEIQWKREFHSVIYKIKSTEICQNQTS